MIPIKIPEAPKPIGINGLPLTPMNRPPQNSKSICSAPGCSKGRHYTKPQPLCSMHYYRLNKHGSLVKQTKPEKPMYCSVVGCEGKNKAAGMCPKHRARFKRYGSTAGLPKRHSVKIIVGSNEPALDVSYSDNWKLGGSDKFVELASVFLKLKNSEVKQSTYANYSTLIRAYILPFYGDMTIDEVNKTRPQIFVNSLVADGRSSGLAIEASHLTTSILREAEQRGIIIFQQHRRIRIAGAKKVKKAKVIKKDDTQRLKDFSFSKEFNSKGLPIIVSLYTGMRIGEVCALKWDDIDLDNKIIKVNKTMQRIYLPLEGGRGETKVVIGSTKTGSSNRMVPISDSLFAILDKYKRADGYMSTGTDSFVEPRTLREHYKSIAKKIGMDHYNFHCLRHTFASRAIESGVDVKTVSTILGHSNIKITMDLYVHPSDEQRAEAINKINI